MASSSYLCYAVCFVAVMLDGCNIDKKSGLFNKLHHLASLMREREREMGAGFLEGSLSLSLSWVTLLNFHAHSGCSGLYCGAFLAARKQRSIERVSQCTMKSQCTHCTTWGDRVREGERKGRRQGASSGYSFCNNRSCCICHVQWPSFPDLTFN